MSDICPAILDVLALDHDDLVVLQTQEKAPLDRAIGITLACSTTFDGKTLRTGKLGVDNWKLGLTELCGSCSFCILLLRNLQVTFDSRHWVWKLESSVNYDGVAPTLIYVSLNRLSYNKDPSPWAVGKQSLSTWSANSISLTGHTYLASTSSATLSTISNSSSVEKLDIELAFELFAEANDPAAQFLNVHRRPLDASALSDENVAKIKKWIKICDEGHERCWGSLSCGSQGVSGGAIVFLPTRLLDVGDPAIGKQPRVVITQDICYENHERPEELKYLALSYCWGLPGDSRPLLKTTHSTIRSKLESIGIETMPKAFQDAIMVARSLGIRFIWIDSLCIIQDDPHDWQIESSNMAEIFSSAYLTVIAGSGDSCHDTFLQRDIGYIPCTVSAESEKLGVENGQISLRPRRAWGTDKMVEVDEGRWILRGWTFQEERLARRALLFGKNKFFLDCRTVERVEDTEKYRLRPDWVDSVSELPLEENRKNDQWRTMSNHWQTMCSHYSYRELTYPSDKLPAISGIASKFSKRVESKYLAGLWEDYLLHDLFWYVRRSATRPSSYRAPSWSWAAVDGHISWPRWRSCREISCRAYCTIFDAKTVVHGLDSFGAIRSGYLKISGALLKFTASVNVEARDSLQRWNLRHGDVEVATGSLDIGNFDTFQTCEYWGLLIAKCSRTRRKNPQARGLLLKKLGSKRDGFDEFQRAGVFKLVPKLLENGGDFTELWEMSEVTTLFVI